MSLRSIVAGIGVVMTAACSSGNLGTIAIGDPAPAFKLSGPGGSKISLKDLNRDVLLVNFWASWCEPCKAEVPVLNELYRKHKSSGLTIVGISVEEPKEAVDTFVRKHQIEYPVLLDSDGSVSRRYGLIGMPMNVLIDRRGVVATFKFGVVDDQFTAALANLTRSSASAAAGQGR
jgi:peroxiredoxin